MKQRDWVVTECSSSGASPGHRLIMFIGPCGAGKSTLSRWLSQQPAGNEIATILLSEGEVYPLDALQPFATVNHRADPADISLLLDGVRSLCAEWNATGSVWITDQFLPAVHWLLGIYPRHDVHSYAEKLLPILAPLNPLLVMLEADIPRAWRRAVADRGQEWSDWMVDVFSRRNLPLYPGEPIRDLETLLRFLEWIADQSRRLLAGWPVETVVFNTERTPLDRTKEQLLQQAART